MASTNAPGGQVKVDVAQPAFLNDQMQVSVNVHAAVPSEEAPAWSIEATMNGIFAIREGTDPQLVQTFARSGVLPLVWPYMRELFQSLSIRMRVAPIMLATLDIRYLSAAAQASTETEEQPAGPSPRPEEPGDQ